MSDEPNDISEDPATGSASLVPPTVMGAAERAETLPGEVPPVSAEAGAAPLLETEQAEHDDAPIPPEDESEGERAARERPAGGSGPAAVRERPQTTPVALAIDPDAPGPDPSKRQWYILKVQSNREDSIVEGLQRRVAIAGLQDYFGEMIIPIEMVTEFKNGKKRIVKRKLYPGYIMVNMQITDDTWFLVRDTAGIGDFTGSGGKPIPMQPHEVARLIAKQDEKQEEAPKLKINFKTGDRVKINEGTFENFEGEVNSIDEANGRVVVMINIFGRSTPVELEYWQVESI